MENKEIARIFTEIADILEIQEGNPFRIRSFRKTSQIISDLPFSAAEALKEDPERLHAISGIGKGTVERIREIVESGTCGDHRELRQEVPPSLLDLLEIQNLGPKKIRMFWQHLGICSVEQLEQAAREEKLRELPGMGEKSESKILKSIAEYRRLQGRFRLDDGVEMARELMEHLEAAVAVQRMAAAGSVRRRRETIGDLDILVSCEDHGGVIQAFTEFSGVREVVNQGETKATVLLDRGIRADLRVLPDDCFGAALQYFTGSQAHNVALRERAKRMGYKISEYGLFRAGAEEGGEKLAGEAEEGIYRVLGLPFIPPELRENRGEIEAAEEGRLPRLLTREDLRGDLHMHTHASDGRNSIQEMAAAAAAAGYEYIAVTDHSKALAMARGLDEERVLEQIAAVDEAASRRPGIHILKGIEVDILAEGALDLDDEILSRLDVVVASVHSRFNLSREEMTARICRALENPHVNILAHPTGRLLTRREPYAVDLDQVFKVARENRVCLEINAYPARLDLSDVHCRMARDQGVLISINSDSHSEGMLHYIDYGVFTARRGWLESKDVINTYPLEELKRVLKKETYPG